MEPNDIIDMESSLVDFLSYAGGLVLTCAPFIMQVLFISQDTQVYSITTSLFVLCLKSIKDTAQYCIEMAKCAEDGANFIKQPYELWAFLLSFTFTIIGILVAIYLLKNGTNTVDIKNIFITWPLLLIVLLSYAPCVCGVISRFGRFTGLLQGQTAAKEYHKLLTRLEKYDMSKSRKM